MCFRRMLNRKGNSSEGSNRFGFDGGPLAKREVVCQDAYDVAFGPRCFSIMGILVDFKALRSVRGDFLFFMTQLGYGDNGLLNSFEQFLVLLIDL